MPITEATFVDELLRAVQEAQATVDEHLHDYDGELLLHLLMADLLRVAVSTYQGGQRDVTERLLRFVDHALHRTVTGPWERGLRLVRRGHRSR